MHMQCIIAIYLELRQLFIMIRIVDVLTPEQIKLIMINPQLLVILVEDCLF